MALKDNLKTPYISVYNMAGRQLANNFSNGDLTVVSLRYNYDDEDDDTCKIKFRMSEPKALDILNIKRGTKLQVVWGYISKPRSPTVIVVVRDLVSKYGKSTIYSELECTDYLTYLKTARSPDVGKGSIVDFLRAQVYGRYSIAIKNRGKFIYLQPKRDKAEERDKFVEVNILDESSLNRPNFDPIDDAPQGTRKIRVRNKDEIGYWLVTDKNPIRKFLEEERDIPTSNRSIYVVVKDLMKTCPEGPWFITGRGDTLLIHNRNLGKKNIRSYVYKSEPAQLLDFTAKTKFENFDKQVISYAGMDPKDRKNFYIDDYRLALKNLRNPKEILEDVKITEEQKTEELKEYFNLRLISYGKFGVESIEGSFYNPGTKNQYFVPGHPDKPWRLKDGVVGPSVQDHTNVENPDPYIRQEEETFDPGFHDRILRAQWFTVPLYTYEEAVNITNSRERELDMNKEEAVILVEGDPWIKSEETVFVSNVHSQHQGHYYIKKCTHNINTTGYKTTMKGIKVIPETKIKSITTFTKDEYDNESEDVKTIIEEQYKREQTLFGPDIIISFKEMSGAYRGVPGLAPSAPQPVYEKVEIKFEDLFTNPEYNVDDYIEDIIKASNSKGFDVKFKPEDS